MKIALLSYDNKLPNLALMKLSTHHKSLGDKVGLFNHIKEPDRVYVSVIFPKNKIKAMSIKYLYPNTEFIYGGSGIDYYKLTHNIEHLRPDYNLFNTDISMGFMTRGCFRKCSFCIVRDKEGYLKFNAHLKEFVDPSHDKVSLFDNNILAWKDLSLLQEIKDSGLKVDFNQGLDIRLITKENAKLLSELKYYNYKFKQRTLKFAYDNSKINIDTGYKLLTEYGVKPKEMFFYVLAYPDQFEDALKRVKYIISLGCKPYVMRYNQITTPDLTKLARWVNRLYYQFVVWEDYIN